MDHEIIKKTLNKLVPISLLISNTLNGVVDSNVSQLNSEIYFVSKNFKENQKPKDIIEKEIFESITDIIIHNFTPEMEEKKDIQGLINAEVATFEQFKILKEQISKTNPLSLSDEKIQELFGEGVECILINCIIEFVQKKLEEMRDQTFFQILDSMQPIFDYVKNLQKYLMLGLNNEKIIQLYGQSIKKYISISFISFTKIVCIC